MAKNDNLKDLLTDVADAIREKKGTTELINPQNFADEIKSIETSTSMWTGHADVEGLKAIGWDDEDIAYFQKYGVNWMEEDDELHKVSDDNKALYGVVTIFNATNYKDSLIYLPKIDMGSTTLLNHRFSGCDKMVAVPFFFTNTIKETASVFNGCKTLTCVPLMDLTYSEVNSSIFAECLSLMHVPSIKIQVSTSLAYLFQSCHSLTTVNIYANKPESLAYTFFSCFSLKKIIFNSDTSEVKNFSYMFYNNYTLVSVEAILDLINATNVASMFNGCSCLRDVTIKNLSLNIGLGNSLSLSKASLLYMINNEAATSAITITLHASAYARLSTDADIVEALNNHPLVTLASA